MQFSPASSSSSSSPRAKINSSAVYSRICPACSLPFT
jgi:hypothetical protein